jgi:hypothetical protein
VGSHFGFFRVLRYKFIFEWQPRVSVYVGNQILAVFVRRSKIVRALRSEQAVTVDLELILFCLATENRVILENQTLAFFAVLFVKLVGSTNA